MRGEGWVGLFRDNPLPLAHSQPLSLLTHVQLWQDSQRPHYACALSPTIPPIRCLFMLTLFNLEVKLHWEVDLLGVDFVRVDLVGAHTKAMATPALDQQFDSN